jgi:uncharacterized protein DUF5677
MTMTTPKVVLRPTPAILKISGLIDGVVGHFLKARETIPPLGRWEAEFEAINLFNLVIRDIESIVELAKIDLVLLPGANVLARAAFEISVRAAWMVQPDDLFQRELRWLAHLQEEVRMHERLVTKIAKFGGDPQIYKEQGARLRKFQEDVASALPAGYPRLPGNPSVEDMLESVGQRQVYPVYVLLAGYVHGTHASTWLFRKHLGTFKEDGEFISTENWRLPLWTSWKCLQVLGQYVLGRLKAGTPDFLSQEDCVEVDQAFDHLHQSSSPIQNGSQ